MPHRLRHQLILSHILPYLVLIPLIGLALVYLLESQVVLAEAANKLAGEGQLLTETLLKQPGIWSDPAAAQSAVDQISSNLDAHIMLVNLSGSVIASNDPVPLGGAGTRIPIPDREDLLSRGISTQLEYSQDQHAEVVVVFLPVPGGRRQPIGLLRLSKRLKDVYGEFIRVRVIVLSILGAGMVLTLVLGISMSIMLERPLRKVSDSLHGLVEGGQGTPLIEQGPEEIRTIQRNFNLLRKRLVELEEIRHRLISNIVHELGRSYGALKAAIQALLIGGFREKEFQVDLLKGMDLEVQQLQRHLGDLSNLQDLLTGELELEMESTSLRDYLLSITRPWQVIALDKGLKWSEDIPANLPSVELDPQRLGQAIGNILGNATRFCEPGGTVSVTARANEELVSIEIIDSGPGIPAEEQDRIFMPFYQGVSSQQSAAPGMGLGLSIARDLVASHGGVVSLQSNPGHGSTFGIKLPRHLPKKN